MASQQQLGTSSSFSLTVYRTALFSCISLVQMVTLCKYNSKHFISNRWIWLELLRAGKGGRPYLLGGSNRYYPFGTTWIHLVIYV